MNLKLYNVEIEFDTVVAAVDEADARQAVEDEWDELSREADPHFWASLYFSEIKSQKDLEECWLDACPYISRNSRKLIGNEYLSCKDFLEDVEELNRQAEEKRRIEENLKKNHLEFDFTGEKNEANKANQNKE